MAPSALARLPRSERVVIQLLRDGRLADAQVAARGMGHGVAPRQTTADETGRVYWGDRVPVTEQTKAELDLTELDLDTRPFPAAQFRHEITQVTKGPGATIDLDIRTYDPGLRLAVGPHAAAVHLAPGGRRHTWRFRLDVVRPGVYEGRVRLDLAAAQLPVQGFDGTRHPVLELEENRQRNTGLLLAPLTFTPLTASLRPRHGLTHRVTVEPEGRNSGRLQVRWVPEGVLARVRPLAVRARGLRAVLAR